MNKDGKRQSFLAIIAQGVMSFYMGNHIQDQ